MKDIVEDVYYSMLGELREEYSLPWVPNLAYSGGEFDRLYSQMLAGCQRICQRLGREEDEDVEAVRCACEQMQQLLCRQMFACGASYALMKSNGPVG